MNGGNLDKFNKSELIAQKQLLEEESIELKKQIQT